MLSKMCLISHPVRIIITPYLKMYFYLQMLMKLQKPESFLERIRGARCFAFSPSSPGEGLPEERNPDHSSNPRETLLSSNWV